MAKGTVPTPWEKEWAQLSRRRRAYRVRNARRPPSRLNRFLSDKVPDKLQDTLDGAFVKAFGLIFEKGSPILEKTFNRQSALQQHQINQFAADVKGDRRSLRAFSRRAEAAGAVNLALSGVEGMALGVLGIGLPDIPLFAGMLLRSLYETSAHYGYPHDTPEERYYQLKLIEGALSYGPELEACTAALDQFAVRPALPQGYDQGAQIARTARALSQELLCLKFLQGIPLVGLVGGAYDAIYLGRVQRYAQLNYQYRLLLDRRRRESQTAGASRPGGRR